MLSLASYLKAKFLCQWIKWRQHDNKSDMIDMREQCSIKIEWERG